MPSINFNIATDLSLQGVLTMAGGIARTAITNTLIQVLGTTSTAPLIVIESEAAAGQYVLRRANSGSTAIANNDNLGSIAWCGMGATAFSAPSGARIQGTATQAWTDANQGMMLEFYVTANGTSTANSAVQITSTGLRIPHGSAPGSPVNGDIWTTTSGMFVRINGSTVGPLGTGGGSSSPGGSDTQVQFNDSGSFGGSSGFTYNKTTTALTLTGTVTSTVAGAAFLAVTGGITTVLSSNGGAYVGTTSNHPLNILVNNSGMSVFSTTGLAITGTLSASGHVTFESVTSTGATGTGKLVFDTSPTFTTPTLGTPASGTVTNLTGTASININGTVGATTPTTGVFTTLVATGISVFGAAAMVGWSGGIIGNEVNVIGIDSPLNSGGNFRVIGTTSQAIDRGASITLGGVYTTGTSCIDFAEISGRKANSTDGNIEGYLLIGVRPNGGSITEVGRFVSTGFNVTGTFSVTGHTTIEGVTSTGATGTGNFVYSDAPTFTSTVTANHIEVTNILNLDKRGLGSDANFGIKADSGNSSNINLYSGSNIMWRVGRGSGAGTNSGTDNYIIWDETSSIETAVFSTTGIAVTGTLGITGVTTIDFGSGSLPAASQSTMLMRLAGADNTSVNIEGINFCTSASGATSIVGRSIGGTRASPAATPASATFVQLAAKGRDNSGYVANQSGYYQITTASLWSGTNRETYHVWAGTTLNSTTLTQWMTLKAGVLIVTGGISNTPIGDTPSTGAFTTLSATGTLTVLGQVIFGGTDYTGLGGLLVKGATKAVRFTLTSTLSEIAATDNTGTGSYQPLHLNGSTVNLDISGSIVAAISSTGLAVTGVLSATSDITSSTNVISPSFKATAAAGNTTAFTWQTGGVNRWSANKTNTAETGSDAGSNWVLRAFTDAGVLIDSPISIDRVAGGTMALSRPVTMAAGLAVTGVLSSTGTATFSGEMKANFGVFAGALAAYDASGGAVYIGYSSSIGIIRSVSNNSGTASILGFQIDNSGTNFLKIDTAGYLTCYGGFGFYKSTTGGFLQMANEGADTYNTFGSRNNANSGYLPLVIRAGTSTISVESPLSITDSTNSTSSSTGSLITAGGLGVAGAANIASTITAAGLINTVLPGSPYLTPGVTLYNDSSNWGYLAYGNDANMRLIWGKTPASGGGQIFKLGTSSAPSNSGTFITIVSLDSLGMTVTGKIVGTTIQATSSGGYIASDGTTGISTTITTASLVGKTITIKDGIVTGFA